MPDEFHSCPAFAGQPPKTRKQISINSDMVIKNNFFSEKQSLYFENLMWFDHILFHLNRAGLENMQLTRAAEISLWVLRASH